MSDAFDAKISALQADVAALTTVNDSAVTLLEGLSAQLAAAINQAKAGGLSDEQATELDALDAAIRSQVDNLAAAVTANTAVPPAPTEPQLVDPEPGTETAPQPQEAEAVS